MALLIELADDAVGVIVSPEYAKARRSALRGADPVTWVTRKSLKYLAFARFPVHVFQEPAHRVDLLAEFCPIARF